MLRKKPLSSTMSDQMSAMHLDMARAEQQDLALLTVARQFRDSSCDTGYRASSARPGRPTARAGWGMARGGANATSFVSSSKTSDGDGKRGLSVALSASNALDRSGSAYHSGCRFLRRSAAGR